MEISSLYDILNDIIEKDGLDFITDNLPGSNNRNTRYYMVILDYNIIIKDSEKNSSLSVTNNIDQVYNNSISYFSMVKTDIDWNKVNIFILNDYDKTVELLIKNNPNKSNLSLFNDDFTWINVMDKEEYNSYITYIKNNYNYDNKKRFELLKQLKIKLDILKEPILSLMSSLIKYNNISNLKPKNI